MQTLTKQVERTEDYNQFKILAHNREINKSNVVRLAQAMTEKPGSGPARPILVNEKMEIIDGQHRFLACQSLQIPVYYIMVEGLGLEDAQRFNALQRNWTELDYAKSYADDGNEHYQYYLEFRNNYKLGHSVATAFMAKGSDNSKNTAAFRNGAFQVSDKERAEHYAESLNQVAKYYIPARKKGFALAFKSLMDHPDYDGKLFLYHVKSWGDKLLTPSTDINDNYRSIEKLYNYHLMEDNRIRLF